MCAGGRATRATRATRTTRTTRTTRATRDARDARAHVCTRSAFRGLRAIAEISSEGMGRMSPETLGFLVVHMCWGCVSARDDWGFYKATMPRLPDPSPLYHIHRACTHVVYHAPAIHCARARVWVGVPAGTRGPGSRVGKQHPFEHDSI